MSGSNGSKVRPIETRYRGNLFRSRLEARWAVFFDSVGTDYVYEPDGYDLAELHPSLWRAAVDEYGPGPQSTWYLPDFYLPEWDKFVEIKPYAASKEEQFRCIALSALTGKTVHFISGRTCMKKEVVSVFFTFGFLPEEHPYGLWNFEERGPIVSNPDCQNGPQCLFIGGEDCLDFCSKRRCPSCAYTFEKCRQRYRWDHTNRWTREENLQVERNLYEDSEYLHAAFTNARSYRFD